MATTKKPAKTRKRSSKTKKASPKRKAAKRPSRISGPPIEPPSQGREMTAAGAVAAVLIWEDDPMSDPVRNPIQANVPALPTGRFAITIVDAAPTAEIHPVGTSRFRYWVAAEALQRGMKFWEPFMPAGLGWATPDGKLQVHLDLGANLNAFYRRSASRLEFFHATVGGQTIFTGESPNVVCHELGHAVLDALRPQLFHTAGVEAAAFHESFGDISAILTALQVDAVAQSVLATTGGRLFHSTFLSRFGEQLGFGIRQGRPEAVEPDCLRNAVNSFFYRDPATLPPGAPASLLSSAPHSFSRVFTASFYEALAGMVITDNASPTAESLQRVTRDAGRLIVDAVREAPIKPNYFSQVAAQMISVDETRFARKYRDAIKGAFVRHGVLSLEAAAAIVGTPVAAATPLGVVEGVGPMELPPVAVSALSLGLTSQAILCVAPAEGGGYAGAAAAATDIGSLAAPTHTDAVRSFLEDLLRLGRVDLGAYGDEDRKTAQPYIRKTHKLQNTPGGPTLVRETFDCGFD